MASLPKLSERPAHFSYLSAMLWVATTCFLKEAPMHVDIEYCVQ